MAVDFYLVIPGVEGESEDKEMMKKKAIDIYSWSWGMSQVGAVMGSGTSTGKVSINDVHFTKKVDKSTSALMKACCNGRSMGDAELYARKASATSAGGEEKINYLVMKMKNILVTSYQTGGSSGGDNQVMESVSLCFSKYHLEYTMQEKGSGVPKPGGAQGWDIAASSDWAGS